MALFRNQKFGNCSHNIRIPDSTQSLDITQVGYALAACMIKVDR